MSGVNKVILVGRLGADPELKQFDNGQVCNMSLATSEKWTKDGVANEKTEWHKVKVFGKLAEICSTYLAKGRQVYIEGKIQTRNYEKDGQKVYVTEVIGNTVQFLGGTDSTSIKNESEVHPGVENHAPTGIDSSEPLPF
jgi:single-strand DNA-binding protein